MRMLEDFLISSKEFPVGRINKAQTDIIIIYCNFSMICGLIEGIHPAELCLLGN